jgi:hypothetical protein
MQIVIYFPCFRRFMRCITVSTVLAGGIACGTIVSAQNASHVSQRRINDYAAALERCRRSLLVEPSLRTIGETLPAYISRVTSPLPHEDRPHYQSRLNSYIDALELAAESTVPARSIPPLRDSSSANSTLWRRAARDLGYLPKRMVQVRAMANTAFSNPDAVRYHAVGSEILTTLQLVLDAYNNLRDARP